MNQLPNKNATTTDPSLYLDEDCMGQIFSFVGGAVTKEAKPTSSRKNKPRKKAHRYQLPGLGPYWGVQEAAYLCCVLASVSPKWEQLVNHSIHRVISVPIDVNLDEFRTDNVAKFWLSWLCQHKPSIGKLRSRRQWPTLTKELTHLLQQCDTSRLEQVELYLARNQDEMQNVIAQQCPNLHTLSIFVSAEDGAALPGLLSPALASVSSIEEMEICLISAQADLSEKDGMLLNQLVEHMKDITPLDEGTLEILSLRHPKELRFEPFDSNYHRKCALALATDRSFRSPSFGFHP